MVPVSRLATLPWSAHYYDNLDKQLHTYQVEKVDSLQEHRLQLVKISSKWPKTPFNRIVLRTGSMVFREKIGTTFLLSSLIRCLDVETKHLG